MKISRLPTKALFKQYSDTGTEDLDEWRVKFVEIGDPTEYEAAIALAGSWKEWCRFKKEWKYFAKVILPEWLVEVEIKLRSKAIGTLRTAATAGDPVSAKFLAEGKHIPKTAGRPSKDEVERQAKIAAGIEDEEKAELERINETTATQH